MLKELETDIGAITDSAYNSVDCLDLGLWLGFGLMANGAETIRVEDSVGRILDAYNLKMRKFSLYPTISTSVPVAVPVSRLALASVYTAAFPTIWIGWIV